MSETPVTTAAKTAAKTATIVKPITETTVDHMNSVLPTVVETSEVALQVPSKVLVNNKLVFAVGVIGGAAVGIGVVFAYNKIQERRRVTKAKKAAQEIAESVESN